MPISPSSLNGYDFNSAAERKIYDVAVESDCFNNRNKYLFHSLSLANPGDRKLKGEIDFVYLDNECLLFFEVKGGQVKFNSLKNEWWVLGGTEKGDPFKQAYNSLFHTRDHLLPELFDGKSVSNRLIFGIGVLFPDCLKPNEFSKTTLGQMEFNPELIYDYNDYKLNDGFTNYLNKVKTYWSAHPQHTGRVGLSQKEVITISKYFRKDLNFKLPVSELLKKGEGETGRLTGMQAYVLDNLSFNPGKGGLIMGGPGTGKTILALELLKRTLSEGKRTLLVCFNKNLAEHLNCESAKLGLDRNYEIRHLHSLYRDKDYMKADIGSVIDTEDYWSKILPLLFARNLREVVKESFDYLIIDEGQDILNEYHFDALDKLLKGGFDSGKWTIFMDKEYQNIYNKYADEYFNYIRNVYPSFVTLLNLNCRNTLSTIKRASVQTGFPEMPCMRTDQVWNSEIKFYHSPDDLINRINDIVVGMENDGIKRSDITILCLEKTQINNIVASSPGKYVENAFMISGKINISTIHSYKGLENKFMLICGPNNYDPNDKNQMSLIYIANTRATAQSIFFLDTRFQSIIVNRISNKL